MCAEVHVQSRVRFSRGRVCFAALRPRVRKARGFGGGAGRRVCAGFFFSYSSVCRPRNESEDFAYEV